MRFRDFINEVYGEPRPAVVLIRDNDDRKIVTKALKTMKVKGYYTSKFILHK